MGLASKQKAKRPAGLAERFLKGCVGRRVDRLEMLDAAAVRAAAAEPDLVEADEALRRLFQRGRYVRHSEMLVVHKKLVSAVRQCGGLIGRHLPASARDALGRLASLEPAESIDAAREDINQRFVSSQIPAVGLDRNVARNSAGSVVDAGEVL